MAKWQECRKEFLQTLETINQKVDRFNMIVPSIHQQVIRYNKNKEITKVVEHYRHLVEIGEVPTLEVNRTPPSVKPAYDQMSLKTVWSDIRALFRSL